MNGDLQRNLELLQASYSNVQNVLRFLDTKAGVIFAIAGALLATVISSGSSLDVPEIKDLGCVQFIHFAVLSGVVSLGFAVVSIWPSYGPAKPEEFSWLYPAMHPKCYRGESRFTIPAFEGLSDDGVLEQYKLQLEHLSGVLNRKTFCVRWSLGGLLLAVSLLIIEFLI